MATIDRIPLTDANSLDYLSANTSLIFHFEDYSNFTLPLKLAGGRSEGIGDFFYKVNDGSFTIDVSAVSGNGEYFVLVLEGGSGTATAYLSSKGGTWISSKGGYYIDDASGDDGAKVILSVHYENGDYVGRRRREDLSFVSDNSIPIGSIIGIHPESINAPDIRFWSSCNGVADLPVANFTLASDTKVPDLTDDRFLQGATTFDKNASGSNVHNHLWYDKQSPGVSDSTFDTTGASVNISATATEVKNGMRADGNGPHLAIDAYTNNTTSKPKYFSVRYYMRIR